MPKDTFFNLSFEKQEKVMRAAISEFSIYGFEKGIVGDIAKNAELQRETCTSTLKIKGSSFYIQ
jgi:hypothetical protein